MKKLYYTKNLEFKMRDWKREPIVKVYAGTNCIMAVTSDGRTLQKTTDAKLAPRTQYWTRVRQIAVSKWAGGHAIGLISDGTCMIAKRFVRYATENELFDDMLPFDTINNEVRSWINIKQVAVSDTFFGLDRNGKVHISPLSRSEREEYVEIRSWTDIARIVTGMQDSVFGIRKDGSVLCAGENLTGGSDGGIRRRLAGLKNVTDVCTTGAESGQIFIAYNDGTVTDLSGKIIFDKALPVMPEDGVSVFQSHFRGEVIILDNRKRLVRLQQGDQTEVFKRCPAISSFAVGDVGYGDPFVLAVAEDQ